MAMTLRIPRASTRSWAALNSMLSACAAQARDGASIVPNHMAASTQNPWWRDVLEYGRYSPYARYFDIEWDAPEAKEPAAAHPWAEERGELSLALDEDASTRRMASTIAAQSALCHSALAGGSQPFCGAGGAYPG